LAKTTDISPERLQKNGGTGEGDDEWGRGKEKIKIKEDKCPCPVVSAIQLILVDGCMHSYIQIPNLEVSIQ